MRSTRFLLPCLLMALAACGKPPLVEVLDLASIASSAEVLAEPGSVDIGTAAARHHLATGWWNDELDRQTGKPFVWSRGDHSEIEFFLGWRRTIEVELVGHPFNFPGSPTQTVDAELNGTAVGRLQLTRKANSYTLKLPATAQVVGRNRLHLSYGTHNAPADVVAGSKDRRELAVAWQQLVFSGPGLSQKNRPPFEEGPSVLRIESGTRWDFFINVPADVVLRMGSLRRHGEKESALHVSVWPDRGFETEVAVLQPFQDEIHLDLAAQEGLVRLRFEVTSEGLTEPLWMELSAPAILAPTPPTHPPSTSAIPAPRFDRANVIIYLVDALRADRLGCYGYGRSVSPRLDAFATEGVLFANTVAQSSWTKASVASILTGVWPPAHGASGPEDILPSGLSTLAEHLAGAGYNTAAVSANAFVNRPFGFARGFDHFTHLPRGEGSSEGVNREVMRWLDRRPEGPFFLYIHTIDPHAPYAAPEPFHSRFASEVDDPSVGEVETIRGLVLGTVEPSAELTRNLSALYDAEVAHNDASFGALLDHLKTRGLYEDSLILFVSDHGEAFGEHNTWTHGIDLYSEVLNVPLVLRLPGGQRAGQRVEKLAQHIDILPTLLRLSGIDNATSPGRGRDLLQSSDTPHTAASHLAYWGRNGASVVTPEWKYIEPLDERFAPSPELYDRTSDPEEHHNLAATRPVVAGFLAAQLRLRLRERTASTRIEIDEATKAELQALGYLH